MRPVPERAAAKAAGEKFYFVTRPCVNGHTSKRSTATGNCCECVASNQDAFRRRGGTPDHPARIEARSAGLRRYSTGEPCTHGHDVERWVFNGQCVECGMDINKRWKAARPGAEAKWARERRAKDPTSHRAEVKRYAQKNPDKIKAAMKAWIAENQDHRRQYSRIYASIRRTQQTQNGGSYTAEQIDTLRDRQHDRCAACLKKTKRLEIDHIVAVVRGGSSDITNIQLLCMPCNRSKGSKDMLDWVRSLGRLL